LSDKHKVNGKEIRLHVPLFPFFDRAAFFRSYTEKGRPIFFFGWDECPVAGNSLASLIWIILEISFFMDAGQRGHSDSCARRLLAPFSVELTGGTAPLLLPSAASIRSRIDLGSGMES